MSQEHKRRSGGPSGGPMGGGPAGALSAPVSKANDFSGTLKRLVSYLMPEKNKFIAVGALAVLSTVFSIFGPKVMGNATTKLADGIMAKYTHFLQLYYAIENNLPPQAIDVIKNTPVARVDFPYIGKILLIMLGLYVISALCSFVMGYIMSSVSQKTVYRMRNDVKTKLDRLPLRYFDSRTHGEILSRVTNDMDNIANTLQQSLTQLITSVITIVGILAMMISISPLMTLIALFTLPVCGILTMNIAKASQKYFAGQQKSLGELNGHVEEMFTGHKIIKVFCREKKSVEEFRRINEEYYDVGWKAQFMSGIIMPALNFVNNIGYVLICVVGGLLVTRNAIKVGDVQSFIQYMRQFTQPIVQTANIANIIQSTIASAERVFEVLDEKEELPDPELPESLGDARGEIAFEHVRFGYSDDNILIEDMNILARQGQTVAIVGPTGAGKTTLVNLLMRFYELHGGRITIDGKDITSLTRAGLRRTFGMVLQDTWLFSGTIAENIAYSLDGERDPHEVMDGIKSAARAARADHFIATLPEGYDTLVNEEASNISQGQKQLLTIARAILADPKVLILDEATSSVDTRTELLIQHAMDELMEGRTSFVIAHRLSTIKNADLILVMDKGSVIEQGTHAQLLEKGGFYANLYNSQFSEG